jgi:hypothetical protein
VSAAGGTLRTASGGIDMALSGGSRLQAGAGADPSPTADM